ncbi:MAG: hypothetical protein GEU91_18415 [Rhizobiales bacterium]|nr:hypothetical protein [Hyphomicrobiales bacterium]
MRQRLAAVQAEVDLAAVTEWEWEILSRAINDYVVARARPILTGADIVAALDAWQSSWRWEDGDDGEEAAVYIAKLKAAADELRDMALTWSPATVAIVLAKVDTV